jgi:hypothetical protein
MKKLKDDMKILDVVRIECNEKLDNCLRGERYEKALEIVEQRTNKEDMLLLELKAELSDISETNVLTIIIAVCSLVVSLGTAVNTFVITALSDTNFANAGYFAEFVIVLLMCIVSIYCICYWLWAHRNDRYLKYIIMAVEELTK